MFPQGERAHRGPVAWLVDEHKSCALHSSSFVVGTEDSHKRIISKRRPVLTLALC